MQQNNLCRQNTIRGLYRPRIAFWRQNNFKKKVIWLYSLVEILRRHPEGNIALAEIQWQPPFHGIFQNLKNKIKLKFREIDIYISISYLIDIHVQ